MATFNKFNKFIEYLTIGGALNLNTDTFKVYLTDTTPNAATHTKKSELAGITEEHGYAATDIQNAATRSGATVTMTAVDVLLTASGGSFGPFRYAVIYDDTHADDILMGWYDYGVEKTVASGESFKIDFGDTFATFA